MAELSHSNVYLLPDGRAWYHFHAWKLLENVATWADVLEMTNAYPLPPPCPGARQRFGDCWFVWLGEHYVPEPPAPSRGRTELQEDVT